MAFNISNFSNAGVTPGAFNPTNGSSMLTVAGLMWNYTTSDNMSTVSGANYFDGAPVRPGDIIFTTASDGYQLYSVSGINAPSVPVVVYVYKLVEFSGTTPTTWI